MTHEFVGHHCYVYRKVIHTMVDEGKSLGDIAKELSVNYHSLKTQLRKHRLQEKARVKA